MLALLRAHPVLAGLAAGVLITLLVLGILAVAMLRAGQSLRPLVFFGGFLVIVAGPQALYHAARELGWIPRRDLTWVPAADRARAYGLAEVEEVVAVRDGRFADPARLFGADHDPGLLTDLRAAGAATPFGAAEAAQMAIRPSGETMLAARFRDAGLAERAAAAWLAQAAGVVPPAGRDGLRTVTRPGGDVAGVLVAGRTVLVWTGPDAATVAARRAASAAVVAREGPAEAQPPGDAAAGHWLFRPGVLPAIAVVMLLAAVAWFFVMSSWSATVRPAPGVAPVREVELRARLAEVNTLGTPMQVETLPDGRLAITWRVADARWLDLARARGLRRVHRLLLRLDERTHTVRALDQHAALDWSAGAGGAHLAWRTELGVTLFEYRHERVVGLQLDERGRLTPRLSYAYTFAPHELKAPIVAAVTRAGWRWRPGLL